LTYSISGFYRGARRTRPTAARKVSRTRSISAALSYFCRGQKKPRSPSFLRPRHYVNVQMRHALADAVVDRDERAVASHALLHGASKQSGVAEQRPDQILRQIRECLIMRFRDQQAMAGK
jgi:hypothetical protein